MAASRREPAAGAKIKSPKWTGSERLLKAPSLPLQAGAMLGANHLTIDLLNFQAPADSARLHRALFAGVGFPPAPILHDPPGRQALGFLPMLFAFSPDRDP
jgi:hypothetical protein